MLLDFLKNFTNDYKFVPELVAVIAALFLAFSKVRKWICSVFVSIYRWAIFPFRGQENIEKILTEIGSLKTDLSANTEISKKTSEDVRILKEIVGHNGGGGLLDMVGVLSGFQTSEFWLRAQPGFIADEEGRNLDSTHAFVLLLKLSTKDDVAGISWKSYTDRDFSNDHLKEFKEAVARRETFRNKLEFFDSNGDTCGEWTVLAHPISAEKAKAKRYIGFLYPVSDKAKEIARQYNWPMSIPV